MQSPKFTVTIGLQTTDRGEDDREKELQLKAKNDLITKQNQQLTDQNGNVPKLELNKVV